MTLFLLCWYALGWASVGILVQEREYLSVCGLFFLISGGAISILFTCISWIVENNISCPIIWRKKMSELTIEEITRATENGNKFFAQMAKQLLAIMKREEALLETIGSMDDTARIMAKKLMEMKNAIKE